MFFSEHYRYITYPIFNGQIDETIQEVPHNTLRFGCCTYHDFHPGNQTDGSVSVSAKLGFCLLDPIQIVDQYIGIKQSFYHSDRTCS